MTKEQSVNARGKALFCNDIEEKMLLTSKWSRVMGNNNITSPYVAVHLIKIILHIIAIGNVR